MSVRIVRLGSPREKDEGARLGTVRRPPRGVPRKDFARLDWYDVWFPVLAPSVATMKIGLAAETDRAMGSLLAEVSRGDEGAHREPVARCAGGPVAAREFFGGLLLRERVSLPSVAASRAVG